MSKATGREATGREATGREATGRQVRFWSAVTLLTWGSLFALVALHLAGW